MFRCQGKRDKESRHASKQVELFKQLTLKRLYIAVLFSGLASPKQQQSPSFVESTSWESITMLLNFGMRQYSQQ